MCVSTVIEVSSTPGTEWSGAGSRGPYW